MNITGGKYNSLKIKTADFDNIKPTLSKIRQAVFNSLLNQGEFNTFCDLFAGSGIMSFEAVSRGYQVVAIEKDRQTYNIIKNNSKKLNIPFEIINYDAIKFLQKTDKTFDVFYIDPPYQAGLYDKVLYEIENKNLLNNNGIIILEKPQSLEVNLYNFNCFKEKKYSDKTICYLRKK